MTEVKALKEHLGDVYMLAFAYFVLALLNLGEWMEEGRDVTGIIMALWVFNLFLTIGRIGMMHTRLNMYKERYGA